MFLNTWHNLLKMEKHDLDWHQEDLKTELVEYKEATGGPWVSSRDERLHMCS
ncbi:MAG: hypothetical protein ACOCU8_00270 [Patescibacteria group bacterium]